jgi:hypothetical protein
MYTAFKVDCIIKPKYKKIIDGFITNGNNLTIPNGPAFDCFRNWQSFLRNNGHCIIDFKKEVNPQRKVQTFQPILHSDVDLASNDIALYYNYQPPCGLPSRWGQCCDFDGRRWRFVGEVKNYNREVEYFLTQVIAVITDNITSCWTCYEGTDEVREHSQADIQSGNIRA